MPSAYDFVGTTFSRATQYANEAKAELTGFLSALNAAVYPAPTVSVTWNSIAAPALPALPATPAMPTIAFTAPDAPTPLTLTTPDITIDDFTEVAPSVTMPSAPTLDFGALPAAPVVGAVTVPSAPSIPTVSAPSYLSVNTPAFGGVDLNEAFLSNLTTIPTLTLVAPTPYSYNRGPEYASALLSSLKATLASRMNGGTGLNAAVEQALWDRGRDRETQIWLANSAEIARTSEALGFAMPPGVVAAQLEAAQRDYVGKLSDLSRDVSIKQADLEQENMKQTITQGMELEKSLIDYSLQLERVAFESAKFMAENAVQVYNARVEQYKALLDAYRTYAAAYEAIIRGQLAKVEAFRAQVAAEQAKADVNRTLVEQYKAAIEAGMSQVEIYKAQIGAAQALVEIERSRVGLFAEQIRAYVARVNGETARVEAYKAGVEAETAKVQVYKVKADAFAAKVGAQAEEAKANTARFEALQRAKSAEFDGYRARVDAERARIDALGAQSRTLLDAYRAAAAAIESSANMHARVWEGQVKQYEAATNVTLQAAKINGDNVLATNAARLDAAKAGAQVYAQLTASAYSMIKGSAQVEAGERNSVSWDYNGEIAGNAPAQGRL